ncbi:MAG TPA: hypothetical protein VFN23_19650 [Ktedonobacteraceae bacterium]|nr:hypothetical protein [Ktedonobacteraceae bacterium]
MQWIGCSSSTASQARITYFAQHLERRPPAEQEKRPAPITQQVYTLLAENPCLRVTDLAKQIGCGRSVVSRARITYFE